MCKYLARIPLFLAMAFGCGTKAPHSRLNFATDSTQCKALTDLDRNTSIPNKGFGTVTFTHPEIVSHFTFRKVLEKFSQVHTDSDQQDVIRRFIRSFLVSKVPGVNREQPLRPFVIPELLCPLLDDEQKVRHDFCSSKFSSDQAAAVSSAVSFLDGTEAFGDFAALDELLRPLSFVKRPPRSDLHASEQVIEARVVYGLRDATGNERKPATVIMEFAGTSQPSFYESLILLFLRFKDQNTAEARKRWAEGIEDALDLFIEEAAADGWQINQMRVNELAFRGSEILWNFREYNFPSATAKAIEFRQVPVANTPWIDFDERDKNASLLNPGFTRFLDKKGLKPESITLDQSIDLFEDFLSNPKVKTNNDAALQSFVQSNLSSVRNDSGPGFKGFAYHKDSTWMAPVGLARPGLQFFDEEMNWSKHLKESCQGCHVASSSIGKSEAVDSLQGFYHISPRIEPSEASEGLERAGSNILSAFTLRESQLRFRSMLKLVGCEGTDTGPSDSDEESGGGYSSDNDDDDGNWGGGHSSNDYDNDNDYDDDGNWGGGHSSGGYDDDDNDDGNWGGGHSSGGYDDDDNDDGNWGWGD